MKSGVAPFFISSSVHDIITAPPLAAASVILLRDGAAGLEVFLMRRHDKSDVLGGNYVFPGGKIDPSDAAPDAAALLGVPADTLPAALNETALPAPDAAALFVGAARELFEEAGVLLAVGSGGASASELQHRQASEALKGGEAFTALLPRLGLRLDRAALAAWSRWITPRMPSHAMTKRFDTRFLVAALPPGQDARHDDFETTASTWLGPREALHAYWARALVMMPPQIMTLADLSRFGSVAAVFDHANSRPAPTIEPEPIDVDGVRIVCYPGDERHPQRDRAMPGPTRLLLRDKRFEPERGLDALFD